MSILTPGSVLKERTTLRHYRLPTDAEASNICQWMAEKISLIYPGYLWQVEMNQDLVTIKCMDLDMVHGYNIPLKHIDDEGKVLTSIGGEILERFNVRRGRMDRAEVYSLPRNVVGDAIPEM